MGVRTRGDLTQMWAPKAWTMLITFKAAYLTDDINRANIVRLNKGELVMVHPAFRHPIRITFPDAIFKKAGFWVRHSTIILKFTLWLADRIINLVVEQDIAIKNINSGNHETALRPFPYYNNSKLLKCNKVIPMQSVYYFFSEQEKWLFSILYSVFFLVLTGRILQIFSLW